MRKILRSLLATVLFVFVLFVLASCVTTRQPDDDSDDTYRVMLSIDSSMASVEGSNPVTVKKGESATFKITLKEGYVFKSVSGGQYNQETGTLTVSNVTANTNIDFYAEKANYDLGVNYTYVFVGTPSDTTSVTSGTHPAGTAVSVQAGGDKKYFVGWFIDGKDVPICRERVFSFALSPDMVGDDEILSLKAQYFDNDTIYYDSNGGEINATSSNMSASDYYTASVTQDKVKLTYKTNYLSYIESASTFYDDATFTREGYILKEYNTSSDGSGTAYSIGSKVPLEPDGSATTLYCIWAKATSGADFTYEDVTHAYPSAIKDKTKGPELLPYWQVDGIIITSYTGDDEVVVIPDKIDGKYVTAIGEGAFTGKRIQTLIMGRYMLRVDDGAFVGCSSLTTIYYPDGLYKISDDALDDATRTSLKNLYVNATMAPRYNSSITGGFATKLSRLLTSADGNRLIVIGGSSTYQGLATEYMEALLDNEYTVVNFGTTRTVNILIYLEAMKYLAHDGDIVVYAPENSSYGMGERELYYKTVRELEHMNNFWRYIDISNYTGVFDSLSEYNSIRCNMTPTTYESICKNGATDKYGDCQDIRRGGYINEENYIDTYIITLTNRFKSRFDLDWSDEGQSDHFDYTDPDDVTWCSVDDTYYREPLNKAINAVKDNTGAAVYFGFCPVDKTKLVKGAESGAWQASYDKFIRDTYAFTGLLGASSDYIYDHKYMFDCAFHLNDYGRTLRTYSLYTDLCEVLGITDVNAKDAFGTKFSGCIFE